MSVSRRVGALLCALALILHLVFVPVRARATLAAGALTAVGFAVTVTAFLNLAGIYPFNPDTGEGLTFPDWTDDALQKLIDLYNVAYASTPLTRQTVKSYALGATIVVANEGWNRLRNFVDWIKSEYAPADNAQDVRLGVNSPDGLLPSYSGGGVSDWAWLSENGFYSGTYQGDCYFAATAPGVFIGRLPQTRGSSGNYLNNVAFLALRSSSSSAPSFYYGWSNTYPNMTGIAYPLSNTESYNGVSMWYRPWSFSYPQSDSASAFENIPFYQTLDDFLAFVAAGGVPDFNGVTADTATVTTPAAPAADSEFTGMQVAGLGQGATVDALEDVIESGVQEREQPTVRQVEVEVQAGTEVDSETGEVTENPVVVTPEAVVPSVAELTAPQAFLDTLQTTMTTKFPFCLPFDVMRILSALSRQPQAPLIKLTFHDNFSDADYTIEVDLSPWNGVAAIVREMQSILLLLGFWLNFDKFNVLNIILGQLG